MSIHYLNANDFSNEGGHMVANIGGVTLVMFHTKSCVHCVNFLNEFKNLPNNARGVTFALCDATAIAPIASTSTTPITAVPKFILYNNGVPLAEYKGLRQTASILKFLQEMITQLNQKQQFARPPRTRQGNESTMMQTPQQSSGINRPMGLSSGGGGGGQSMEPQALPYKVTPQTGVREYETSYGLPYNAHNEKEFLDYEMAYKQSLADKRRGGGN